MSAGAKTGGVLLIIFGVLLLISGLVSVAGGVVANEAADEECGMFGNGCDTEQEAAYNALIAGGAVATGLGALCLIIGVALVATSGKSQQQQQQVVVGGLQETVAQQQQSTAGQVAKDPRMIGAAALSGLVILVVFVLIGTQGSDALNPFAEEYPRTVGQNSYMGTLSNTGAFGGVRGDVHEREWTTHEQTEHMVLTIEWTPADFGAPRLRVEVFRDLVGGLELIVDETVGAGGQIALHDEAVGSLEGVPLLIRVGPADQTFISQQEFRVEIIETDLGPR